MRIAILGSVSTTIPPQGQAAIEKLAYYQAKGLAEKGHSVLLFALEGSKIPNSNVKIVNCGHGQTLSGIGHEGEKSSEEIYGTSYKMRLEIVNLSYVIENLVKLKDEFDLVLNNLRGEAVFVPVLKNLNKPFCHILHLPLFPELADLFKNNQTRLISISNAQRKTFPDLNYAGTVYNGVDTQSFSYSDKPGEYLLYLGSIGPNKNPKDAILAAKEAGEKIIVGGRIKDKAYYEKEILPHIDGKQVVFMGEKHEDEIIKTYQGAKAFLFPTLWEEPFGLVLIEALSCGTPVIAYPNGAIPEVVEEGKNGYLVKNVSEMAQKIKELVKIDRKVCRQSIEEKFSIEKMVSAYEKVLLNNK